MENKTEAVAKFVSRYDELELVTLRIRDAFDPSWWQKVRGKPSFSEIGVSLADEGMHPLLYPTLLSLSRI